MSDQPTELALIPTDQILVNTRVRGSQGGDAPKNEKADEETNSSIKKEGLLQTILVCRPLENEDTQGREFILVAGFRRYTQWCKLYPNLPIAAIVLQDNSLASRARAEFSENHHRQPFNWQEENKAIVDFVDLFDGKLEGEEAEAHLSLFNWKAKKEDKVSITLINQHLRVRRYWNREISLPDTETKKVSEAESFSKAFAYASGLRKADQAKKAAEEEAKTQADISESIREQQQQQTGEPSTETQPEETKTEPKPSKPVELPVPLENKNFLEWKLPTGMPKFNLIHCDFPYGIDMQEAGDAFKTHAEGQGYPDSFETYQTLLDRFLAEQDKFIQPDAHMIFWFSMKHYTYTIEKLREAGWTVPDHPIIWRKTVRASAPDAKRVPRRVYETAFFCYRGDAELQSPGQNHYTCGTTEDEIHSTQKPLPLLWAILTWLVRKGTTRFFDPTCGSGGAVVVAKLLGADGVLGLEVDKGFHEKAVQFFRENDNPSRAKIIKDKAKETRGDKSAPAPTAPAPTTVEPPAAREDGFPPNWEHMGASAKGAAGYELVSKENGKEVWRKKETH